ncbi:MAG: ABC transporter permease [Acidimicrobiales bacterium]
MALITDVNYEQETAGSPAFETPGEQRAFRLRTELRRHPNFAIAVGLLVLVTVVAVLGHFAPPHNPLAIDPNAIMVSPKPGHWFGTDEFGRDVLSRILYGMGIDLVIGLVVASLALLVGSAVGLVSGYLGGAVDDIVMRLVDIVMSFPSFLLALAIAVVLGNNVRNVVIAVTIAYVPYLVRLTRSSVLSARGSDYVLGARAAGGSKLRIMAWHVLPNAIGPTIVQAALMTGWAILDVSGLSFLGVGIQPPSPELGVQVAAGSSYITSGQWWVSVFPGVAIIIMVLAFNFLGDYAEEKLRGHGA